jgi:hypothetical protein
MKNSKQLLLQALSLFSETPIKKKYLKKKKESNAEKIEAAELKRQRKNLKRLQTYF